MKNKHNFENIFGYDIDFILPGFEKKYPKGTFSSLSFSEIDSYTWHATVKAQLLDKMGKKYHPVYRMGDGEFIFFLGHIMRKRKPKESILSYKFKYIYFSIKYFLEWHFIGFQAQSKHAGYVSGGYTHDEINQLKVKAIEQIKYIGEKGSLAPILTYRFDTLSYSQYFTPLKEWFLKENIHFTSNNYIPFYFIYSLLLGPERSLFYKEKNILVITHYTENKKKLIYDGLKKEGVNNIEFIQISKNRSFYDKIDLKSINHPIDLVLVGAGLGAINILSQLEDTQTLCIDAGYVIEAIANPSLKKERTFCSQD